MTTELQELVLHARTDEQPARCAKTLNCLCGQQLDDCTREHCPRCGRTLTHR